MPTSIAVVRTYIQWKQCVKKNEVPSFVTHVPYLGKCRLEYDRYRKAILKTN